MTDPEIAESAITRRYGDSLVIEIPWSPEGYILEVACLRGDGQGGGRFFSQVFKINDDFGDAGAVWNSEDAPGGGASTRATAGPKVLPNSGSNTYRSLPVNGERQAEACTDAA